ncbi:PREDICTED: peptide chain release factor 1-like, mitochondrial [Trachymyrmex cornetzi]|uniref:Peptide chain release factor 1-like, mitochondrial n=1 Tax=Trachymyrmex cornetzi TaxID=471704 RepID=A0A151J7B0_9HYME|nr:PREDICTED: peptide chain release factor 1-like, mitochondrial [Trachymyrmex cornetzi]KYN19718.1 Peptide chain release factor 1-like, mitochondrial [Trachymyrmex cornetzi]
MSLLVRRCKFDSCWYSTLVNRLKLHELHAWSLTNLIWTLRSFCNARAKPNILDDKTKKFLDYLTNEYRNKSWQSNNFVDFVDLNASGSLFNKRVQLMENIQNLHDLGQQDVEIKKLAEEETMMYKEQLNELDERLLHMILTNMYKDFYSNIIIEITAGVGGQEAMLFVKDLYDMYIGYAKYLDLDHEVIDIEMTDNKGIRHASIMISGDQADKFQHEGGVHRVQRVPATEKSGRVHTSTASVAILPVPSEIQIMINEKDLKIETKRSSGAGGQHVNTTDSAVRITHLPSGLSVTCQVHRSQGKNKEMAMDKLRSILYEQQLNKQTSFTSKLRQRQMGMGFRNEKIRTYNYNQDRVTDHRLGQNGTFNNLIEFMQGGVALEELEDRLYNHVRIETLFEVIKKLESRNQSNVNPF